MVEKLKKGDKVIDRVTYQLWEVDEPLRLTEGGGMFIRARCLKSNSYIDSTEASFCEHYIIPLAVDSDVTAVDNRTGAPIDVDSFSTGYERAGYERNRHFM